MLGRTVWPIFSQAFAPPSTEGACETPTSNHRLFALHKAFLRVPNRRYETHYKVRRRHRHLLCTVHLRPFDILFMHLEIESEHTPVGVEQNC